MRGQQRGHGRGNGNLRWGDPSKVDPLDELDEEVKLPLKKKPKPTRESSIQVVTRITKVFIAEQTGEDVPILLDDQLEINEERPTLNYFRWSFALIDEYIKFLKNKGSHQHDQAVRKLVALQVLLDVKARGNAMEIEIDSNITDHGVSIYPSILVVAEKTKIGQRQICDWMRELLDTGDIEEPKRTTSSMRNITETSQVSKAILMEVASFAAYQREIGQPVNYNLLSLHLASDQRYNEVVKMYPESLPPTTITPKVLNYACNKLGLFGWGPYKRVGKLLVRNDEHLEKRKWKMRVYLCRKHRARLLEIAGKQVTNSRDESYCYYQHTCKQSLLPYEDNGKLQPNIQRNARDGPRMCMSIWVNRFGVVTGYVGEDPANGPNAVPGTEPIRDCAYFQAGIEVEQGGSYAELGVDQKIRIVDGDVEAAAEKPKPWKQWKVADQRDLAEALGLPIRDDDNKFLLKAVLMKAIEAKKKEIAAANPAPVAAAPVPIVREEDKSKLEQLCGHDWRKIIESYRNQAHTTFKFFPAGQGKNAKTDYHDNFTVMETVKIYVAAALTWDSWCLHMQLLQNSGKISKEDDDGHPWYNFITRKAMRKMRVEDDNAPYNYGVCVALKTATKMECAKILRLLEQTHIEVTHTYKDGVTPPLRLHVEVPAEGVKWTKQGDVPNANEVRAGTLAYVKKHHPYYLKPAFHLVLQEFDIEHDHTVC